jgi:hypothetical protein
MIPSFFRVTLLIIILLGACDRTSEPGLHPFEGFRSTVAVTPSTPVEATAAQRRHDARHEAAWRSILDRLDAAIEAIADARRLCGPADHDADPGVPGARMDREGFGRLRTRVEADCERLMTDIAQADPTGAASALFLPSRRLGRNIRTVLLSTLEISCATPAVLDARLEAARLQLKNLRDYLDGI